MTSVAFQDTASGEYKVGGMCSFESNPPLGLLKNGLEYMDENTYYDTCLEVV